MARTPLEIYEEELAAHRETAAKLAEVTAERDNLKAQVGELAAIGRAAMKFIDSHRADPDITNEMTVNYNALLDLNPRETLEQHKESTPCS